MSIPTPSHANKDYIAELRRMRHRKTAMAAVISVLVAVAAVLVPLWLTRDANVPEGEAREHASSPADVEAASTPDTILAESPVESAPDANTTAPSPTPTPVTTAAHPWPQEVAARYVNECNGRGGENCTCFVTELQARYTVEDFAAKFAGMDPAAPPPELNDIIRYCS